MWIANWDEIDKDKTYIVCPIHEFKDRGTLYLANPGSFMLGWQVKRLMAGCYAALEKPPFSMKAKSEEK